MMKRSEALAARLQRALYSVKEIETLEREVEELRKERNLLRKNRGKFGHGCKVESSFFGTHVEMGKKRSLRVMFFWHTGRPALRIQTVKGVPPLEFVVNEDGTLEVLSDE